MEPAASAASAAAASAASASASTISRAPCVGVTVIVTKEFLPPSPSSPPSPSLCALLVREGDLMEDAGRWTAPMGDRDGDPRSKAAAKELEEEAHLALPRDSFRDPGRFTLEHVPFLRHLGAGGMRSNAVFVCRGPPEEARAMTPEVYRERRAAWEGTYAGGGGARPSSSSKSAAAHLETDGLTFVPVRRLLAAVPRGPFDPRGGPSSGEVRVRDVGGDVLSLRPNFVHVLRHPGVRAALAREVAEFEARHGVRDGVAGEEEDPSFNPVVAVPPRLPPRISTVGDGVDMDLIVHLTGEVPGAGARGEGAGAMIGVTTTPSPSPLGFRLYVSSLGPAEDLAVLRRYGITHVVNCCAADLESKRMWTPHAAAGIHYAVVHTNDRAHARDLADEDPSGQWPAAMALVREAMQAPGGAVLIHCWMGVNRSVTTAAVFLTLHNLSRTVREGIATIKRLRPAADPMPAYVGFAEAFVARVRDLPPYRAAAEGV
jgi:predicted protein tyrosine phosphatase